MKITLCLLGFVLLSLSLPGQPLSIRGQAIAEDTGTPLSRAHIQATGKTYSGTVTNEDGHFSLHLSPGMDSVRISYLGYRPITLPIETFRQDAPAIVRLIPEAFLLQAIDVRPVSARALVQEAIARMAKNYD